jgi:hypothetical protein
MEIVKTRYIIGNDANESQTTDRQLAQKSIRKGFLVRETKNATIYTENSIVYVRTISDMNGK